MVTWKELRKIIIRHTLYMKLFRKKTVQNKYDRFQKSVLRHYHTMNDYIYCTIFRYKCEKKRNKFGATFPEIKNQYVITENAFPYDLAKDIEHYVLWYNTHLSTSRINKILKDHFKTKNILWYRSVRESVPDIEHVHVFVQKPNSS